MSVGGPGALAAMQDAGALDKLIGALQCDDAQAQCFAAGSIGAWHLLGKRRSKCTGKQNLLVGILDNKTDLSSCVQIVVKPGNSHSNVLLVSPASM